MLMLVRGYGRLFHAELWAEDGHDFVADFLNSGWPSIFKPLMGSLYVIERAIDGFVLSLFPLAAFPTITTFISFAAHAWLASRWVKDDYAWLIPDLKSRWFLALLITLSTPGMSEMAGNITNLNWLLFYFLALTLLKDPRNPLKLADASVTLLVSVSCAFTVLLVPLAAWRSVARPRSFHNALPLLILVVNTVFLALSSDKTVAPIDRPVAMQIALLLESFVDSAVYAPWIGDWPTIALSNFSRPLNVVVALLFFAGIGLVFWRKRNEPRIIAILLLVGGLFLWPYLNWLARPGRIEYFELPLRGEFWRTRYSFPMAVSAFVAWFVFFGALDDKKIAARLAAVFFTLNLIWGVYKFRIAEYGPEKRWLTHVADLQKWRESPCTSLKIPIYPDGWFMELSGGCLDLK